MKYKIIDRLLCLIGIHDLSIKIEKGGGIEAPVSTCKNCKLRRIYYKGCWINIDKI